MKEWLKKMRKRDEKIVQKRDRRKNTAGRSVNIRWEKNKINSGWRIRVRKMSGSINNLLKVKSVRYDILFSLKG